MMLMDRLKELADPLAPWKFYIDVGSAICAFIAAAFWLRASLVRTPAQLRHFVHMPLEGPFQGDVAKVAAGVAKQSKLNAWAAGFAATAAVLTGISVLIGTRWG